MATMATVYKLQQGGSFYITVQYIALQHNVQLYVGLPHRVGRTTRHMSGGNGRRSKLRRSSMSRGKTSRARKRSMSRDSGNASRTRLHPCEFESRKSSQKQRTENMKTDKTMHLIANNRNYKKTHQVTVCSLLVQTVLLQGKQRDRLRNGALSGHGSDKPGFKHCQKDINH